MPSFCSRFSSALSSRRWPFREFLSGSISQPILNLADTARLVSREKDYSVRAPVTGDRDEVARSRRCFQRNAAGDSKARFSLAGKRTAVQNSRRFHSSARLDGRDPDGDLTWYNHRWYEYTGTTPEQMAGWGWQAVHDPEFFPKFSRNGERRSPGTAFEMIFPLRGGGRNFSPILDPGAAGSRRSGPGRALVRNEYGHHGAVAVRRGPAPNRKTCGDGPSGRQHRPRNQ